MVRIRLRHVGTRRGDSDADDCDRGAAAAADDKAPVSADVPDRGAPSGAMGVPDGALRRGALSPTPCGSPAQSFPRSARVAPTHSHLRQRGALSPTPCGSPEQSFPRGAKVAPTQSLAPTQSHLRQPPFRIRFRIPIACCPAREPDHGLHRRGAEALPLTSSDDAAALSLPWRAPFAPPAAPLAPEEKAKVAEKDAKKCFLCAVDFNLFKHPHHCKICGESFCKKCSKGRLPLTDDADAPLVRVCDKCLVAKDIAKKCLSCAADFSLSKRPHRCRKCHGTFCRKCSHGKIALTVDDNAPTVRVCDKCLAEVNEHLKMAKEAASTSTTMQTRDGLAGELKVASKVELSPVPVITKAAVNTRRLDLNVTKASDPHVALIYDARMLAHKPPKGTSFHENPERLESIMQKLKNEGITNRCQIFESDLATTESLLAVHSTKHVKEVETLSLKSQAEMDEIALEHDYSGGTYYCQGSTEAAQVAAGSVIKACDLVACGRVGYSFALVRPPGHHVGRDGPPAGFCLLNNVAIGAAHLIKNYHMQKILILDWDIHHGDGTQDIFFGDKRVLFFSIHRFHNDFFPHTNLGSLDFIGIDDGVGQNINVCFKHSGIRDADYIAVWDYLLLPLIQEFEPEIIFISAGFDAAQGDPLGECEVTAAGFANLLEKLMSYPIVMTLEGGYELSALSDCIAACVKVLLGDKPGKVNRRCLPYDTTWAMIKDTREKFKSFWTVYATEIPEAISSRSKHYK